ncbi:MAG: peptidoglycan bridge formation glycyltransferase FemA/FemB family protein [Deltaproteobacteria bacterium]|nr:peptidoglycan bridge formation glycyltransferase FemA/FemB family protein [Deltaproteobacteria bacterium]
MPIEIINPIEYPNWDKLLLTNKDYSFFHTSSWARVLFESYGYKPIYFTLIDGGKLSALIAVMEINSWLTGKRGVSLPFTDFCSPIVYEKSQFKEIIKSLIEYGRKGGWKYIEVRGGKDIFQDITTSSSFYTHTLDLTRNEHEIFSSFRVSTKQNIKKAIKEGVNVILSHSLESVKEFCRLNRITRKHHGLPPQPYYFFKKVHEHIISNKKGVVVLASYQKKNIAGAICFQSGNKAIYKFGAFDRRYQYLRPTNLLIWEIIKWYEQNGFKTFSFGRTEPENTGLLQFKRGWGTKQEIINYYKYNLVKDAFVKEPGGKTSYNIFKLLPSPLLNLTGFLFYKHVG